MARRAGAGELRTRVRITRREAVLDELGRTVTNENGYPVLRELGVLGEGETRLCKWEGAWGKEVYEAVRAGVEQPATLTMRYVPGISADCLIYRSGDGRPYQVVSVNDVGDRRQWLEIKVKRKEKGL